MFDTETFVRENWPKDLPLRGEKEKRPNDGELSIMFKGGDFKIMWDPDNEVEVEAAREVFEKLKKKTFNAYLTKLRKGSDQGEKDTLVRGAFDPEARQYILSPPVAGGCR